MDSRRRKGPRPLAWYEGYEDGLRDALWAIESTGPQRIGDEVSTAITEVRARLLEMLDGPAAKAA